MSTLLLRLAAPMQSWGSSSKFDRRLTEFEPTKSGVIGLLACAMGLKREASLAEFKSLRFGVRIDQAGTLGEDYQIAQELSEKKDAATWVTHRYYLFDAVFLAGVEGDTAFLAELQHALVHPAFPIFLGRRSCPPVGPLVLGMRTAGLQETLRTEAWQASTWYQRRMYKKRLSAFVEIVRDAGEGEDGYAVRDVPDSFSQQHRLYHFRDVVREQLPLSSIWPDDAMDSRADKASTEHDPMKLLEENDVSVKD